MMTLKNIYTYLFFIGLFFIPFNEFEGLSFLGEYKSEAATYFFLFAFGLLLLDSFYKKKIDFPYKQPLVILLIMFVLWTFFATLMNFDTVSDNFYKQTSGVSRYIRQTISLLISAGCFTFLFWNVIKDVSLAQIILKIRKVLLYSFIFVAIYGFIEIGIVFFGLGFLRPILNLFEYLPFINNHLHTGGRIGISSVTFEIPALGNYLIFVTPWLLSYIFTEKKLIKFIPSIVVVVLMMFSNARAALVVITFQLICFVVILWHDQRYRKAVTMSLKVFGVLVVALLILKSENVYKAVNEKTNQLNFSKNLTKNVSNKSRFGMQYAALEVFKENPVCGVGFGQGAYHMRCHYPYWATANNYEFRLWYKNQQEKSFPPAYNLYTRLMAELGIIGVVLFLGLMILPIYYSLFYWQKTSFENKYIGVILLLSFIGFAINWLQIDFFRQYGFWLAFVILIKAIYEYNKNIKENKLHL